MMQHQRKCVPLTVSVGISFGRSKLLQSCRIETRTRTNCRQWMLRRFCVCIVDLSKHRAVILGNSCHLQPIFTGKSTGYNCWKNFRTWTSNFSANHIPPWMNFEMVCKERAEASEPIIRWAFWQKYIILLYFATIEFDKDEATPKFFSILTWNWSSFVMFAEQEQ